MSKSITGNHKKRGRPSTGERSHIAARASEEEVARVDAWAAEQGVPRAEAIRRLIQRGLEATKESEA